MNSAIKDITTSIISIILLFTLVAIAIAYLEEKPHVIMIEGKRYMRSKEYVGDGKYQIIIVPIGDSTIK